ncbi:unnamed protein product [Brugia timori]|uniref:Uncharacterized protein n=1 Tax=Brugia timori TaxID=42155 RepID=A0A0R3Q6E4_9BILA|nr:unnamed protein product [Brugia timori]
MLSHENSFQISERKKAPSTLVLSAKQWKIEHLKVRHSLKLNCTIGSRIRYNNQR